jgi:hypothetical protein
MKMPQLGEETAPAPALYHPWLDLVCGSRPVHCMTAHRQFSKSDRALELFENGVDTVAIAVRLGTSVQSIGALLKNARDRRAREIERAGKLADIMGHNV